MKKCLYCDYDFSYAELLKENFKVNSGKVICPNCHQINYVAVASNLLFFLLSFLPFVLMYIVLQWLNYKGWIIIPCVIFAFITIILLAPYITRFKKYPDGLLENQFREMEQRRKDERPLK